ncbi:MAG TPA: glycosyltransferase family 4 protein [Micropepsaceae bacterium]|nr:glycosyltransferase family 4 protein [Micropepsaceae bacterium]
MIEPVSSPKPVTAPVLSILTVTTLFPNPVQKTHGVFVETRLRKLLASGGVAARVLAPIPWLPSFISYSTLGPLHQVPSRVIRDGLTIDHPRYLVVPKIGMSLTPHTLYRAMRKSLKRILHSGFRVDLIDAHYFYPDGVAAVWLAQEFNLPVTITARGTDLNLIPQYSRPRRLIQQAAANADGLITVCKALKDSLIELGVPDEKVLVLRNGVDLQRFRPGDREQARSEFDLTRPTLASVGHLVERKGHHHVIRALAQLPGMDLLIAGAGPERQALESLATQLGVNQRVRFLGAVDQARLCRIYNAVDALVLASSREGWANVLLEAMACGTPVVASAVWGTPEVVAEPEAGVLMPSQDDAGVVAGVKALFANLPQRTATRAYAEGFDWEPTTQGQLTLFREILARRGAKGPQSAGQSR